jgi:septum formation protein
MASPVLEVRFARALATFKPRLILGTASSSRRAVVDQLAAKHNFEYLVRTADIDEKQIRHEEPRQLVSDLAHAKADAIIAKLQQEQPQLVAPGTLLLTCDQVVVHDGSIREKPTSQEEARAFIASYAVSPASTVGAVLCTELGSGQRQAVIEVATIHMRELPPAHVEQLLQEGDIMWCAGGLMVEHPLVAPYIDHIDGSQDTVMGLGSHVFMELVAAAAEQLGAAPTAAAAAADGGAS